MKRILILALVATLALSSLFSCANNNQDKADGTESESESVAEGDTNAESRLPAVDVSGEGFELALSEDKSYYTFVSKGASGDSKIIVPSTFNGVPVKAIAEGAFAACEGITEIIVSEGVTSIGKDAFAFSVDLKSVTLPNSLTEISERAFYSAANLESVTVGNKTEMIGNSAFENCSALKAISLPDTVKSVGTAAFYNCTALADIKLGNAIESIGFSAFDATAYASNAQNWADKVLYCESYLLKVSEDKANALNIKDGTTLIADHAAKQSAITEIKFPSSLKYIGSASFTACQGITALNFNEGIISIGDNAFSSCDAILTVDFPSTLTNLEAFAFFHCSSLKAIEIPSGVTKIADEVFNNCESLEDITLPETLEGIGVYSFANCVNLKHIKLPDSLKVIGESSFYKCYNLMSVNLPKSLTKIEGWAFQYCHKLVDVKNESALNIVADHKKTDNGYAGTYAKEIHNGESVIVEQDGFYFYTFGGKNYLMGYEDMDATSITLPESFNGQSYIIYKYAISFRPELKSLSIPAGATAINSNSIDNCQNLTTLTLGKSVTSIGKNAISNCVSFNKLIFLGTESEFKSINVNSTNSLIINAQKVYN